MIKKLLFLLVLLLTATTGAWATTPNSIVINGTPLVGDKSISLTYHFDPANVPGIDQFAPTLKVKCAADNKWDEVWLSLSDVSSGTTNITLSNLGEFEAGKTYQVCFAYYNGDWVDEVFQSFVPAAPTYSVTLAEGTEDDKEWTISPTEAAEGTTVTATYKGEKKVKSVKAVKKAAKSADGHALSASAVGEIVGSDGKAYAVADKDNLPSGVTAVAMVAYKSATAGESLAIQLNGSPVEKEWDEAKTYPEGLTAVTGGTWRLPSKADWQNMLVGCAVSGDASASNEMNPIAGFKAKIAATGITWKSVYYWSSTESEMGAWSVFVSLGDSNAAAYFDFHSTSSELNVLGCLAF